MEVEFGTKTRGRISVDDEQTDDEDQLIPMELPIKHYEKHCADIQGNMCKREGPINNWRVGHCIRRKCNFGSNLIYAIASHIQCSVDANQKQLPDYVRDDWTENPNKTRKGLASSGFESSPVASVLKWGTIPFNARHDHPINYALLGRTMMISLVEAYNKLTPTAKISEEGLHATDGTVFDGVHGKMKMVLAGWDTTTLKPARMYKPFCWLGPGND